jgi:hypothetical protein
MFTVVFQLRPERVISGKQYQTSNGLADDILALSAVTLFELLDSFVFTV